MKHRIVKRAAFRIVGLMKRVPVVFRGINPGIAQLSSQLTPEIIERLNALSDIEPGGLISASANFSLGRMDEQGEMDHYIGVATSQAAPADFSVLEVPASDWAVFEIIGPFPQAVQLAWGEIYAKWLPSTDFESTGGPEILWHAGDDLSRSDHRAEIWIPLRLKPGVLKWFA